jgi:hypothetical protein
VDGGVAEDESGLGCNAKNAESTQKTLKKYKDKNMEI